MRVLMLEQAAIPGQMLAAGVVVVVDDVTAAWLIEAGAAQAVGDPAPAADAQPDQPAASPEPQRATRRKQG